MDGGLFRHAADRELSRLPKSSELVCGAVSWWNGSCRQMGMMRLAGIVILAILSYAGLVTSTLAAAERVPVVSMQAAPAVDHSLDTHTDHDAQRFVTQSGVSVRTMVLRLGPDAATVPSSPRPGTTAPLDAETRPAHPPNVLRALLQVYRI
jgi:hypothetical protein